MKRTRLLLLPLIVFILPLAGCQSSAGDGPRVWIDMPLDRTQHPLAQIQILAHASSPRGVASFSFAIDGDPIGDAPVGGGRFEAAEMHWTPPEAGIYTLEVMATDSTGVAGELSTSILYIGDAGPNVIGFGDRMYGACEGVEAMHLAAHPGFIPPGACTLLAWEVAAPEDWALLLDGERVEPWGEQPFCFEMTTAVELRLETPAGDCRKYVIVDVSEDIEPAPPGEGEMAILFIAEPDAISRGQCAELYWQVETPEPYEITLDEQLVEPVMGREVCPEETTTYHLIVHRPDGPIETARTVEVLDEIASSTPTSGPGPGPTNTPAAPDTTPPAISSYTVNPLDFIYTYKTPGGAYCTETPTAFYFSATVTDAGGVASVVLDWTGSGVRNGPATLNPIGGNQYVHSLGLFLNPGLLGGFSITATDNASNTTTVYPTWSLDVEQCNY